MNIRTLPSRYIAVILARGGSKRLPRKNVLTLSGKPLIQYSIEYALACRRISHVFVSTDDDEIEAIAKQHGAVVIRRTAALASDIAKSSDALRHAVEQLQLMQIPFDNVVLLQPTSPLRPPNLLDKCIDSFDRNERGSLATVSPLKFKVGEIADDHFIPLNYSFEQRTQDLKGFYFENGLIYITKKQEIVEGRIFSADLLPYVVDSIHAHIDIDTREDLDYAEFVLSRYRGILDE